MLILLTDETNQQPSKAVRFFVYGGLFLPIDNLPALSTEISAIRQQLGLASTDTLKFDERSIPESIRKKDRSIVWDARKKIVTACAKQGARFVACICHHNVAEGAASGGKYLTWAANEVLKQFHDHLLSKNDYGICLFDNMAIASPYRYLREKGQLGLVYPTKSNKPLSRIVNYGFTCVDAGHANSAVDVVLGLFRTCINDPQNTEAARKIMADVAKLLVHAQSPHGVFLTGLTFRPLDFNIKFKADYSWLQDQIKGLISGTALPESLPPQP